MSTSLVQPGNPGAEFNQKFGPEHGPALFAMGVSFEHAERIFQMSMRSGMSFALARAALAQKPPQQ